MKKSVLLASVALLMVAALISGCTTTINKEKLTTQTAGALLSAPDFEVTTTAGDTVSLSSYLENGKPTIVYFMASWCPTCAKNWPILQELHNSNKVNLLVVSIDPTDTSDVLTKLAAENGLTFPMVPGNPQLMLDFGVKGQATTVYLNAEGKIQNIKSGELVRSEVEEFAGPFEKKELDMPKTEVAKEQNTKQAPEFSATTTAGDTVSLATLLDNGKPTIVYFMATWCPTCAKNWPDLETLHKNKDANVLAISIDPTDTSEVLNKLAAEKGFTFPMVPGNPELMLDFGVKGQATSVFINSEGNIVSIKEGDLSLDEYRAFI